MKKYTLLIFSALFTVTLLISACSKSDKAEAGTDNKSESTTASADSSVPKETTTSGTDTSDTTATTTSKQEVTVTASSEETPLLWTETQVELTMYAAKDTVVSFREALEDSKRVNVYRLNHEFNVIALTDTGFYKLKNGEFIHVADLSDHKTEQATFISSVDATIYTTTPARE